MIAAALAGAGVTLRELNREVPRVGGRNSGRFGDGQGGDADGSESLLEHRLFSRCVVKQ
jgi:hypothetical protein